MQIMIEARMLDTVMILNNLLSQLNTWYSKTLVKASSDQPRW